MISCSITLQITEPLNGDTVPVVDGKVKLRGYAYSGGGAKVKRC